MSYLHDTIAFFVISWLVHGIKAYNQFASEQKEHGQTFEINAFWNEFLRQTTENWQSEFLQLIWQVGGLSFLWYVGSPSSKEGDERKEELMQEILRQVNPKDADRIIGELAKKYPKK